MSEEDRKRLQAARGVEFDRMFATTMIAHREGVITMTETEIADGGTPTRDTWPGGHSPKR